jgi:hypothetical protein
MRCLQAVSRRVDKPGGLVNHRASHDAGRQRQMDSGAWFRQPDPSSRGSSPVIGQSFPALGSPRFVGSRVAVVDAS